MMPCPYRESACSRYTPSDFSIRDGGAAGGDRCARGTLNGAKVAGITMGSVFCSVPGRLCASRYARRLCVAIPRIRGQTRHA